MKIRRNQLAQSTNPGHVADESQSEKKGLCRLGSAVLKTPITRGDIVNSARGRKCENC